MNFFDELDIDSAELFEDILISNDKFKGTFYKNNFYLILGTYNGRASEGVHGNIVLEISKKDAENYYIKLVEGSYYVEDYDFQVKYNKEIHKDELLQTIERYTKELITDNSEDLEQYEFLNKKFTLKGMNFCYKVIIEEYMDSFETNKQPHYILYLEDENKDIYRFSMFTELGMCGSGYQSASWGIFHLYKMEKEPPKSHYLYIPRTEVLVEFTGYITAFDINFTFIEDDLVSNPFSYDDDGGDAYYPSGGAYDLVGLEKPESLITGFFEYFKYSTSKIKEVAKSEEVFPYNLEESL